MMKHTILVGLAMIWLAIAWPLVLAGAVYQSITVGSPQRMIVEYNVFESSLKLSSKIDFANVKITFDDTPGQFVTLIQLRDWVKAQHTAVKPPPQP